MHLQTRTLICGAHVLPLEIIAGLDIRDETLEQSMIVPAEGDGAEGRALLDMDIVSHDVRKFFKLLLKNNGYVLEQLFSPLIVHTTAEHAELKEIAAGCITRNHYHHYRGFLHNQWKLFEKESEKRVKPLLYVFRVVLTGIHLMRAGELNASLVELNQTFRLPYIADLIARKQQGEHATLSAADVEFYRGEKERLDQELDAAHTISPLPEGPSAKTRAAINDLLVRIRLNGLTRRSVP